MGKCRKIADCLSGGVFADGGHILVWENAGGERQIKWEEVVALCVDDDNLTASASGCIIKNVDEQSSSTRQVYATDSTKIDRLTTPIGGIISAKADKKTGVEEISFV